MDRLLQNCSSRTKQKFSKSSIYLPEINPSMENLPADVVVDILTRLPVKTIIHCKCVCKKWQNLINNSYFINLHLSRSPAGLMVQHGADDATLEILQWVEIEDKLDHHHLRYDPVINFDLYRYLAPTPFPFPHLISVGSVNGLICILQIDLNIDDIHICNPITREYLTLPRRQNYRNCNGLRACKFGVNSLTGEYKVLRFVLGDIDISMGTHFIEAEVYTLGTSQWRNLGQVPYRFRGLGGPFLNGYFHGIVNDKDASEKMITFDLDKETFQLFPSPPPDNEAMKECRQHLGVIKGCLCRSDKFNSRFTIWVMKEYGIKKSWHKELVITQAICGGLRLRRKKTMYVFGGLRDGSILVVHHNKLLAYYRESKTIEEVAILGTWRKVLAHRPSFIKLQDFDLERVRTF